jgi:hypothetical protein
MTLVQSWIDSLQLLKPKNLQLFALVTLKSIVEAYKLMFKYFWWLIAIIGILFFIASDYFVIISAQDTKSMALYAQINGIAYLFYSLLFLAVCFATRPSVAKKDCGYFRSQYKKVFLYWLLWVALLLVSAIKRMSVSTVLLSSYSPWCVFMLLFFMDSEGGIKNWFVAWWRTVKMIIYNYPLLAIMGVCFSAPYFILSKYIVISPLVKTFVSSLLLPIGICTYANIYIKKLHDQFDLYIKQPQ